MRNTSWAVVATVAIAASSFGCAKDDPGAKQAIQAAYDTQSKGYAAKNVDTVLSVMSPGYEEVNGSETDLLPKYRDTMTKLFQLAKSAELRTAVKEAKTSGDTCTVIVDRHIAFVLVAPKTGEEKSMAYTETDRDTWGRDAAKGWLKRRSVVVGESKQDK